MLTQEATFVMPTSEGLDRLRQIADPLADDAVAQYFGEAETVDPGSLFGQLARHTSLPPEEQVPAIRDFLSTAAQPPAFLDEAKLERGQDFFNLWASHHFSAMYLSSLPSAYAAAKGVQVLHLTARLRTDTERRLNETAQFLMDVSAPGSFAPGGVAIDRILHIRLMHAAVRWLIANDPTIEHTEDAKPPRERSDTFVWSDSWGLPANQEDLAGTLLTFTVAVYDVFDRSGVDYTTEQIEDHLHLWRVIAHHLGIHHEITPRTRPQSADLRDLIWRRQHAPSAAGVAMTTALLDQAHEHVPHEAWPLIPAAFRYFLGDEIADMIEIPPSNRTVELLEPLARLTRFTTQGKQSHEAHQWFSEHFGRWMLNAVLAHMRGGDRPSFAIPTHLAAELAPELGDQDRRAD